MFDWWRRIIRAGRPGPAPAEVSEAPAASRLGERHWLIVPPFHSGADDLHPGLVGEPWRGMIVEDRGTHYHVRLEGEPSSSLIFAIVREDHLYPTAEVACDAYIEAMEAAIKLWDPNRREAGNSDHRGASPPLRARPGPNRGELAAQAPTIGGHYWLTAPVHDALNLGFGV